MSEPFLIPEVSGEWHLSENPRWQPPEQIFLADHATLRPSCDVWSFGMTVLQVRIILLPSNQY